ncbi:hypothetical protein M9H77_02982 [Catharanthus roseus]|uniref:Uncharacterized protein n=1 Tax=Catharanthus roseus TaxID=4058 RepID=A0ACC0C9W8_CATRO|nr:hypothetical protein M9H77_02982 [Catharanthus roseus]
MKLMGNCSGNCTYDYSDFSRDNGLDDDGGGEGECCGGGPVVVVGVKLDSRSRELLTWALVKIAQSGDRVIALHVIDPNTEDKATLLSLVKKFDSLLAAYEGFCNLKQVNLKLKVSRGRPVRKVLAREAISFGAMSLIVGTSGTYNAIRSSVAVAKYCARNVGKDISVIAADNGKILFQREATTSTDHEGSDAVESWPKRRKTLAKSPLSLSNSSPMNDESCSQLSSLSGGEVDNSMALVPYKRQQVTESHSGWALLRKTLLHSRKSCSPTSAKKSSVMQWVFKLQSRQSLAVICPDRDQTISATESCQSSDLENKEGAPTPFVATSSIPGSTSGMELLPKELEGLCEKHSSRCRLFSYQEIQAATSNFNPENVIGKGGSSKVYKGILPDGKELAVKILKPSEYAVKQFVSEIEILTTLEHKNIISLFGFCFEDNNLLLVYDLLSRGSLEDNLHDNSRKGNLFAWEDRYKVALGVAEALEYLHDGTSEPIIHRDVKSSNILLSSDFEPKLSDFGLAMLASSTAYLIDNIDVAGTFGYLAPEYFMHGKVIDKIDVYAYGVVLLELLSGRKPIDNGHPKGPESLVLWATQTLKGGKFADLLDPNLVDSCDHDQLEKMVIAATLCIRRAPQFRPQISVVVKLLKGVPEVIKWSKQEVKTSDEVDSVEGEQSATNIQSFINLALLNLEDDSLSSSSAEPTISVEDYLQGRCSRSSSFDQTPD